MSAERANDCYIALELSQRTWLIGYLLPGSDKVQTTAVAGGNAEALLSALERIESLAGTRSHAGCAVGSMRVCFEAGYDGFWLARFLIDRDIDTTILDPSSFLVSRRGRRVKTDRVDVEAMVFTLKAYLLGDRSVFRRLEARIRQVSDDIEKIADTDERARRLMTIPGIGPLGATAILSAIGDPTRFSKARDIAAWLGLVPRQYSTGGKQNLLGISKRGNNYLRRLIIHGARSCMLHLDRGKDRLGVWIDTLRLRMHVNKVTVALAAKLARIVWVVLTKPGATYMRQVAA